MANRWREGVACRSLERAILVVRSIGTKADLVLFDAGRKWLTMTQATISFSFLWLFSLFPIRAKFYEFFVLSHIAWAMIALVGTF